MVLLVDLHQAVIIGSADNIHLEVAFIADQAHQESKINIIGRPNQSRDHSNTSDNPLQSNPNPPAGDDVPGAGYALGSIGPVHQRQGQ